MNYKRIVILLICILGAAAFCGAGSLLERGGDTAKQKAYAASDKRESRESGKIAVVNLDEGISGKEGQVNYAQKLSRFPSMDFEYASLEAARTGLETGRYGAYVIIPAAFSRNVESINTEPKVSRLEYAVNQTYSDKKQYELFYNVRSYIDSLSNHLSYMYVDNILREFHEAQDGAKRVIENDRKDIDAIEKIRTQDLLTLTEVLQMPAEGSMPDESDLSDYSAQGSLIIESLDAGYENSIQKIQTQIASLSAGKTALSEDLKNLTAQTPELDFTVDENGENIAEEAEVRLREELERQSEHILEKEDMVERLQELRDRNEEVLKRLEHESMEGSEKGPEEPESTEESIKGSELPEHTEETVQDPESPDSLSLLVEQTQELDLLIEEVGRTEKPDIDKLTELIKTEYIEPINFQADEAKKAFRKRYEEELAAVEEFQRQLNGFQPQMNDLFLEQSIQRLGTFLDNNYAYAESAWKSSAASRQYAEQIRKNIDKARQSSEEIIAEGLSAAKEVKEKSSSMNQRILADFTSKLAYTRIGSAEYTQVYQFIANPLSAMDRSANQVFLLKEE
jgi:uncharacterized phage infection (PIP) family protein YhgE